MPGGKPAGVACPHLDADNLCSLHGLAERPRVCSDFRPCADTCGSSREEALQLMTSMEDLTSP
jgi:uncharacterized protein